MAGRLLLYLQDPGGVNFFQPVLKQLGDLASVVIAHRSVPISLLSEVDCQLERVTNFTVEDWNRALIAKRIDCVICTLSSKHRDLSNAHLIQACRHLSIPSFGCLDHWKGLDRLLDQLGEPTYAPTILGVIDQYHYDLCLKLRLPSFIEIIGHPKFESIENRRGEDLGELADTVLLVSQPDIDSLTFSSLYLRKFEEKTILEFLFDLLNPVFSKSAIGILPHPKEDDRLRSLDKNGIVEKRSSFVKRSSYVVGFDSIFLIESALQGKAVYFLDQWIDPDMRPLFDRFGLFALTEESCFQLSDRRLPEKLFTGSLDRLLTQAEHL